MWITTQSRNLINTALITHVAIVARRPEWYSHDYEVVAYAGGGWSPHSEAVEQAEITLFGGTLPECEMAMDRVMILLSPEDPELDDLESTPKAQP